ncbi:MAG TPA: hypothetical protein VLE95_07895 [Chlamydiales bacterium]|nr:hypothetical protein [Chlamydiales bacterium]
MTNKERPRISIYIAASIDGYIARKDNSLDWMDRVGGYDEDYGFKKLLDSIDTLVSDCVNSFKYLNPDLPDEQSAERDSNLHQVVEREHKARRDKYVQTFCLDKA